jgi:hypothetical protein
MRVERLGKLKNFDNLIGTRTRDIPVCSIVPQPTTLLDIAVSSNSDCIFMQVFIRFIVNIVKASWFW